MHPLLTQSRWTLSFQAIIAEPALYLACAVAYAAPALIGLIIDPFGQEELNKLIETGVQPRRFILLGFATAILSFLASAAAAAFAHHYFLNRNATEDAGSRSLGQRPFLQFLGWSAALWAVSYSTVILAQSLGTSPADLMKAQGDPDQMSAVLFSTLLTSLTTIVGPLAAMILFCMAGTMFPAIIHGGDASLRAAFRRGGAWRLLGAILTGPVVCVILLMVVSALVFFSPAETGAAPDLKRLQEEQWSVLGLLTNFVVGPAANVYIGAMIAATLSRHYLRREHKLAESRAA